MPLTSHPSGISTRHHISFFVVICALLGYVRVPFSTHMLYFAWVEASFEVLSVYSIAERAIGAPAAAASDPNTPTTASPSSATASSAPINLWHPSPVAPTSLVLVGLHNSEGFSDLGCHIGHSAKPVQKLIIIDFGIGQRDGKVVLDLNPINQLLYHCLLSDWLQ